MESKELRQQIRNAMVCDDIEHLQDESGESCYECQVDKVLLVYRAAVTAEVERAKAELEALLLGEDAPEDFIGDNPKLGHDMFNKANTAWRQHIRNKLGSGGKDNG